MILSLSDAEEWTLKSLQKLSHISPTNVHTRKRQFVYRSWGGAGFNLLFDTQIVLSDSQRPSNVAQKKRIFHNMCSDNHSTVPHPEKTMWGGRDMMKLLYIVPIAFVFKFDLPTYVYAESYCFFSSTFWFDTMNHWYPRSGFTLKRGPRTTHARTQSTLLTVSLAFCGRSTRGIFIYYWYSSQSSRGDSSV